MTRSHTPSCAFSIEKREIHAPAHNSLIPVPECHLSHGPRLSLPEGIGELGTPVGGPSTGPLTPRHKGRRRASNKLSYSNLDRGSAVMIIMRACTVLYLLNRYSFQSAGCSIASAGTFSTIAQYTRRAHAAFSPHIEKKSVLRFCMRTEIWRLCIPRLLPARTHRLATALHLIRNRFPILSLVGAPTCLQ